MCEGLDVVGADGLARRGQRHVVKNGFVDGALKRRRDILCRNGAAGQMKGRKTAAATEAEIEGAAPEPAVMDAMQDRPLFENERVRSGKRRRRTGRRHPAMNSVSRAAALSTLFLSSSELAGIRPPNHPLGEVNQNANCQGDFFSSILMT